MAEAKSSTSVEYRAIPDYPGYRVGNDGSVWSQWTFRGNGYGRKATWFLSSQWRQLKPTTRQQDGRKRYTLRFGDSLYKKVYASVLVLTEFIGPRPSGFQACHNDGQCTNDHLGNIRWDTEAENINDKRKHGTVLHGESINTAKLTVEQVKEIRLTNGPLKPIAERFGVTSALICAIRKRKVWKHV